MMTIATLLLTLSFSAYAQSPGGAKTPTGPATSGTPASLSIEGARAASQADLDHIKRELDEESNKGDGFDPCRIKLLELQQKYAQWFKDRYQEFNQIEKQIDEAMTALQDKIAALKSSRIQAIAVPGQTTATVSISFNTIVSYLRNYNSRIKSCSKEKLDLLKEMQENPERNPLKVAHSQVVHAMETMTSNLNASLKESGSRYKVGFEEAACGYDLVLSVELDLAGGLRKEFRVSLLEGNGNVATVDKAAKWAMFYGEGERIGDYSASGNVRFLEMYHETIGPECALTNWSLVSPGELQSSLVPYVSFKQVDAEVTAAAKRGNSEGIGASTRQTQIQKRLKLELRSDTCSTGEKYGMETFAPYLDGKQVATGCVYSVQLVEFSGDIFIFGIGADHNVFMRSASSPVSSPWTRITSEGNIMSLVDSGIYDNHPYFVVLTNTGDAYPVDVGGAKIPKSSSLLPSNHLGNTPARRLTLDAPGQCRSQDGHGSLKLDGKALPASGCVRQFLALPFYNDFFIFGVAVDGLYYRTLYSQWVHLNAITGVAKLTEVSISTSGHPQVTYTTTQAQVQTVELR